MQHSEQVLKLAALCKSTLYLQVLGNFSRNICCITNIRLRLYRQ